MAWPLVLLLSYTAELVVIGVLAFLFFLGILVLQGLEERANARGGSLFRHGRPRPPPTPSWHVDEALSTALEWMADGRDEAEVAAMLNVRTHRGEDLDGGNREMSMDRAVRDDRERTLKGCEALVLPTPPGEEDDHRHGRGDRQYDDHY